MTRIIRNSLSVIVAWLFITNTYAQGFKNQAALSVPDKSGFYIINVTPDLSRYLKTNLNDIRIVDEEGKQVTYILRTGGDQTAATVFDTLPVLSNQLADSGKTVLILRNWRESAVNYISLAIRNASVSRTADISGSDDGTRWFTIAENMLLDDAPSFNSDDYLQRLNFPRSSYKYFKVTVNNGKNAPLNILYAITSNKNIPPAREVFNLNPAFTFLQTDSSDRYSYIRVNNPEGYQISRIAVDVSSPKFFNREICFVSSAGQSCQTITSDANADFPVPVFKDKNWLIKIYNGDNPPLKIATLNTKQQLIQLVTYMENGKHYRLLFNDPNALKPDYELERFKDSIPDNVTALDFGKIENTPPASGTQQLITKKWLWPVLILVLAVVLYFTVSLLKDMKKEK